MKKYNLLLPIAGKAQRFIDAGYTMPKALILAKNKHVIDWAMDSVDTKDCLQSESEGEFKKVLSVGIKTKGDQIFKVHFCDNKGFHVVKELKVSI